MIGPTDKCPNGIGLVFFDLDDTILMGGTTVSPRVTNAIMLARERGCMTCVSSGRPLHMVPEFLVRPEAMDYLVCANGALVHDTIGDVLYERLMTREQALALMDALRPLSAGWNAFIDEHAYFEWRGLSYLLTGHRKALSSSPRAASPAGGMWRLVRRGARFAKRVLTHPEGMSQVRRIRPFVERAERGVAKMGCSLPSPAACERALVIIEHLGGHEVARMSSTELEITAAGVTKGTGARWLMDTLGIDPSCAVAFGDSENDVPLAEACGTFVAMANGDAEVRELADDVCESIYDDGVARWLERAMAEADGAKHV